MTRLYYFIFQLLFLAATCVINTMYHEGTLSKGAFLMIFIALLIGHLVVALRRWFDTGAQVRFTYPCMIFWILWLMPVVQIGFHIYLLFFRTNYLIKE